MEIEGRSSCAYLAGGAVSAVQPHAVAADGFNLICRAAQLASKSGEVDVQSPRGSLRAFVRPNRLDELPAGNELIGVADQASEDRIFDGGEVDALAIDAGLLFPGVNADAASSRIDERASGSSYVSVNACDQLLDVEGLGEVVVGAAVEGTDPSLQGVFAGEHDDGRADSPASDVLKQRDTIAVGQDPIEEDDVDGVAFEVLDGLGGAVHGVDVEAVLPEGSTQPPAEDDVVIDEKDRLAGFCHLG